MGFFCGVFFFNKGIVFNGATSESFQEFMFWKVFGVHLQKIGCLCNIRRPQLMHKKPLRMLILPSQEPVPCLQVGKELAIKYENAEYGLNILEAILKATVSSPCINVPY